MKSTWFGDCHRYEFARLIHEADHSKHTWETFRLWLEVAYGAFRQGAHKFQTNEFCPKIEELVTKAQKRVKHPQKFTEALGVLVDAIEEKPYDFIGTTMGELGLNDKDFRGQLFTPKDLCRLVAQVTLGEIKPSPRRLMLDEPACGGGAMVIAAAQVLKENGFYPWNYWFRATDIDWRCHAITYVQLTLLGIPAWVIHGNTLTVEMFDSATTLSGLMHPLRKGQFGQFNETEALSVPSVSESGVANLHQLQLFTDPD